MGAGLPEGDPMARLQRCPAASSPITSRRSSGLRIVAGKMLARRNVEVDDLADVPLGPPQIEVSSIASMTDKHAFAQREAELLNSTSSIRRKEHLILRHMREIGRIVRLPLDRIRV